MSKYESSIKHVPYTQAQVYEKIADLSNLQPLMEHLDKLKEHTEHLPEDIQIGADSISFNVKGFPICIRIVEREPQKCIKFEGDNTPIPLQLWIQILPVSEVEAKLKVTLNAEISLFLRPMLSKPLEEGVEKIAEMLAKIPYA